MTKAEEAALKKYPFYLAKAVLSDGSTIDFDASEDTRNVFKLGYEQAEKDLGWISVKDRLPNTTEYVFTCVEMNGIPQCVGFHYYKDGKWWEGYEEDEVGPVEYWMPIPKLPKEEEK